MSRLRILITRRWPQAVERRMADFGEVTLNLDDHPMSAAELTAALESYDVVCPTVTDPLPASVWPARARTRILCNYGVGVNHIDLEAARAHGAVVTNTPDVLTEATAEIALTLLLMIARRAGEGERELRAGQWRGWRPGHLEGQLLAGKTVGVVGFGRIGQCFARKARFGLGMKVVYYARRRAGADIEAETGAVYEPSLDRLVEAADAVSLHTPGGPETHHLIDAARLARMKPTAYLINTARGSVVDCSAAPSPARASTSMRPSPRCPPPSSPSRTRCSCPTWVRPRWRPARPWGSGRWRTSKPSWPEKSRRIGWPRTPFLRRGEASLWRRSVVGS